MKAIYGFLAAGLVGTCAWAQEATIAEGESAGIPAKAEQGQVEQAEKPKEAEKKEKSLIGKTVFDENGTEIGRVQDLVMDAEKGELGYVVLEVKGDGEPMKLPVPERALKPGEREGTLVLNVSQSVLAALEVYRDEELPEADAFSVESETAVGRAAGSEEGSGTSSASGENEK